jgi:hypothetical protein
MGVVVELLRAGIARSEVYDQAAAGRSSRVGAARGVAFADLAGYSERRPGVHPDP